MTERTRLNMGRSVSLSPPTAVERVPLPDTGGAVTLEIDVAMGQVLAASPAAIRWFGADPTSGAALDRAMPAMLEIAAFANERQATARGVRTLLFWTPQGPRQLTARLELKSAAGGRRTVLVTTAPHPGDATADRVHILTGGRERLAPRRPRTAAMAEPSRPDEPPRVRSDTETLREIARRIREGRTHRLGEVALAANEAPSPALAASEQGEGGASASASATPAPRAAQLVDMASTPAPTVGDRPPPQPAATGSAVPRPAADGNARLAHELRTPLGAIAALAEIMRDERLGPMSNPRYRDYASDIEKSAKHALSVVTAMLSVDAGASSAAQPSHELSFADVDLVEVARECLATLAPSASDAGIETRLVAAERLPRVVADRRTMKQILLNLLTNAIRATGRGGRVEVGLSYELAGPVRLEVRDTGIGMTDEQIGRIFSAEPGAFERDGQRSGFGLPLAIAMADANGASLAIGSEPGAGTRVSIIFDKDRVVPV